MADPAEFQKFYDEQESWIDYQVSRMRKRPEDRDDLRQEVWLKLWRTFEKYDPARCAPKVWAWMKAREAERDHRQRVANRPLVTVGLVCSGHEEDTGWWKEAIVNSAVPAVQEVRAWTSERMEIVRRATTDVEYQVLLNLWIEGRTENETAEELGITRKNVEAVKYRCLQRLINAGTIEGWGTFGLKS